MRSIDVKAYAKINLTLDIVGVREDGYHTVDMVMQSVSLHDRVKITLNDSGEVTLCCSKPHIPTDMKNTAYKAARYFLDAAGLHYGADIYIEKVIPDQAGMGGGSADAAAVLRGLNHLCEAELGDAPLNTAELLYIGMRIGADVPFCIMNGTQRCGGIGELLIPVSDMPKCGLLIAKPDISVSTPEAYKQCDTKPDSGVRYTKAMLRAVNEHALPGIAAALGNRFDDALQLEPVQEIKKIMLESGAMNAVMTGSGSAVFGIFETVESAEKVLALMDKTKAKWFVSEPVTAEEAKI